MAKKLLYLLKNAKRSKENMEKTKKLLKIEKSAKIYVVVNRYMSGIWGIADFWHKLPYASTSFKQAQEYKRDIYNLASINRKIWSEKDFKIIKISLVERSNQLSTKKGGGK